MTPELLDWLRNNAPDGGSVLEVGAFNVNGTARDVIPHAAWFGTDMREGPGVDFVCDAANLPRYFGSIFDTVVCLETLEHCEDWKGVLTSMWDCLEHHGRLILSTPGPDFPRHDYPSDYWRFSLNFWQTVFHNQFILKSHDIFYPHNGHVIIVIKTSYAPLNLNITPYPVP